MFCEDFKVSLLYMVSKVVINLLMQPANWAVRNSHVSYAYILVGKAVIQT